MQECLGLVADNVSVRGSKFTDPPVPISNRVQFKSAGIGRIDDQIDEVFARIRCNQSGFLKLVKEFGCSCSLVIVRYFDDVEGDEETHDPVVHDNNVIAVIPGQHQLLGWSLNPDVLSFLCKLNASIDADEYG